MISRLKGTLLTRDPEGTVEVETAGGVVYEVDVPLTVLQRMPSPGSGVELRTVQVVREDAVVLFGHSYGGYLALEYALCHPDRLRGLVLCDTGPALDYVPAALENAQARGTPAPARFDIDLMRLQLDGFVTPQGERTRIVEEYRIVKRPLLVRAFGKGREPVHNGNLIMVTSARPREGKSFTAVNLAMSLASERDINVLLVDADIYNLGEPTAAMGL
ncbi:MAG: alpha/beta fold hydrolase, partial [Gemmatimonadetes bacterium]|nr:alpha/beta fold hydrolase [Gemmatimonadota bacterium]